MKGLLITLGVIVGVVLLVIIVAKIIFWRRKRDRDISVFFRIL